MMKRTIYSAPAALVLIAMLISCGPGEMPVKNNATLASISVTPANPQMAILSEMQFIATGIFTDQSTLDITPYVTWATSDESVAVVSNAAASKGLATSMATGSITISASLAGITASTPVTVTPAKLVSIAVTPVNLGIARGTSQQFTAMGTYSDNTTQNLTVSATWSSSDPAVASISNASGTQGLAAGRDIGSATITASFDGKSGTASLTVTPATLVSLSVDPTNPSIALGLGRQFTATGIYSDTTTQNLTASATWNSSDPAVATISNSVASTAGPKGMATSVATGATTITASLDGFTGTTLLTVTPATPVLLTITPADPSIALGTSRQFTATGIFSNATTLIVTASVAWYSSDAGVAQISNAAGSTGLATSVATGATTITAALSSISGTTMLIVTPATLVSLAVTPVTPSIARGTGRQFTATGTYSDGSKQNVTTSVAWRSSDAAVASISNAPASQGFATSFAEGTAVITAATGSLSDSTTLTVTPATLASIAVTPANTSLGRGTTRQFTAMGTYSDNTAQDLTTSATWISSGPAVATISNAAGSQGLATAVANGQSTITASSGRVSGSTAVTVADVMNGTLLWDAVTTYEDGSALPVPPDYRLYYGASPGIYTTAIAVGNVPTYVLMNFPSGAYYFAVTAYDAAGNEGAFSNEISVQIP
jgi:trimeric autotransporter adhesin